jgi:hypothetical protein
MSYGLVTPICLSDFLERCETKHLPELMDELLQLARDARCEVDKLELALYAKFLVMNVVQLAGSIPTAEAPLKSRFMIGESSDAAERLSDYEQLFPDTSTESTLEPYSAISQRLVGAKGNSILAIALREHRLKVLLKSELPFFSQLRISTI